MNDDQWRVFTILGATLGIELLFSPGVVKEFKGLFNGDLTAGIDKSKPVGDQLSAPLVAIAIYGGAAIILIGLAAVSPLIATWIAALVLLYAFFAHASPILDVLSKGQTALRGK